MYILWNWQNDSQAPRAKQSHLIGSYCRMSTHESKNALNTQGQTDTHALNEQMHVCI